MSETARALGLPGEIEWKGRQLKVSRVYFKIEALFELHLEANRDRALERSRSRMSPEAYRDRLKEASAEDAYRAFAWDGDIAKAASATDAGLKELGFLCISDLQPDWTRTQHEELFADRAKAMELVRLIYGLTQPLPNGEPPGPQPGGNS